MERFGDPNEIRLVAILRTLKKTQDEVAEWLHMGKERVGRIENWLRMEQLDFVEDLLVQPFLHRTIDNELTEIDELDPADFVKVGRLTTEDILRYFRSNYISQSKPALETTQDQPPLQVTSLYTEQYLRHCAKLGELAEILNVGLSFNLLVGGEWVKSKYSGLIWCNWSFSKTAFNNSSFIDSPEIHFNAEESDLWCSLVEHLDIEFPGFSDDLNKFKQVAVGFLNSVPGDINRDQPVLRDNAQNIELKKKLHQIVERQIFEGSCDICRNWKKLLSLSN
jgi:hypothetical protein